MLRRYRVLPIIFSLLLHGGIAGAAFFIAAGGPDLQTEPVYHVSLAEFAQPVRPFSAPEEVMPTQAQPLKEALPEPLAMEKPTPASPKKEPKKIASKKSPDAVKQSAQPAAIQQPERVTTAKAGSENSSPHPIMMGGFSAYAEDVVDQRPSIARKVAPAYPVKARRMNVQGRVTIKLVVDTSGAPQHLTVHSADPPGIFDAAALAAAEKSRFIPGKIGGKSVNTVVLLPYRFTLQ